MCGMEKKEPFLCMVELLVSLGELPASMTRAAEAVSQHIEKT